MIFDKMIIFVISKFNQLKSNRVMKEKTFMKDLIKEHIKDSLFPIFGKIYIDQVANKLVDEVYEECVEADDGDIEKAIKYVLLDKLGLEDC